MSSNNQPVVVEQEFENPLSEVWRAIPELDRMKEWIFDDMAAFAPEAGFRTDFTVQSGQRIFTHQ